MKVNPIIPEVIFKGDSICFVVAVFCNNESIWLDTDVAVITVGNLEFIVKVVVVGIVFVSEIKKI